MEINDFFDLICDRDVFIKNIKFKNIYKNIRENEFKCIIDRLKNQSYIEYFTKVKSSGG